MSRRDATGRVDPRWFDELYADEPDPWGFEHRWYEQRKYALTLAALPRPRYRRACEPGCSTGVLTEGLAARCDALIALDPVADAVERARTRLADAAHVEFGCGALPEAWPAGRFDLVVLSEVGYYLSSEGLDAVAMSIAASLEPGGHLLAVHYSGNTDYPLTARFVHDTLAASPVLRRGGSYAEELFLLDWFERR